MGKVAIILVVGLTLTVAVVAYTLNRSKTGLVENVSGFHKYTTSRDIAHTGVNLMLRLFDTPADTTVTNQLGIGSTATVWRRYAIMGGVCSVSVKLTNPAYLDTLDLTAKSIYMDSTRNMALRLHREPVPYPVVGEAVGLRVDSVDFHMTGSALIDGRNHNEDGTLVTPADSTYKPGVGVIHAADTATVNAYASKINGTTTSVYDPSIPDPSLYVDQFINAARYTYPSGVYNSFTWGSETTPTIVYCNGDVKFNGNAEGWGLLIVQGDLTLAGTFKWHGLVICYNTASIDVQFASGTPDIIGAVIMAGPSGSLFEMKGNSTVAYSKDAVNNTKFIGDLQKYTVMYWYE